MKLQPNLEKKLLKLSQVMKMPPTLILEGMIEELYKQEITNPTLNNLISPK